MTSDQSDTPPPKAAGDNTTRLHDYLARFGHRRRAPLPGLEASQPRAYGSAVEVDTPDAILRGERTALHAIFVGHRSSRARFCFAFAAPTRPRHLDAVELNASVEPGACIEHVRLTSAGRVVAAFDQLALTGPRVMRLACAHRPVVTEPLLLTVTVRFRASAHRRIHFESAGLELLG